MEEGREEVAFLERSGAKQSGAEPSAAELLATGSRREDRGGVGVGEGVASGIGSHRDTWVSLQPASLGL